MKLYFTKTQLNIPWPFPGVFLVLLLAAVAFSSCSSKKKLSASDKPVTVGEDVAMVDQLSSTQLPYTWFSGSGQGRIDWEGQRLAARINIRIKRDSIIWVQISKLGFEVGRMLVTPDSAFFINRFEHTYGCYKTQDFLREYRVPVDFDMFSNVFTAGAYVSPGMHNGMMGQDGSIQLSGDNGVSGQYWFDASRLLVRSIVTDALKREWSAGFADYKTVNSGQAWPFSRTNTLVIDGVPNVFDLEYTEIEIDVPQSFPFSVPSHYEKI